MRIRLLALGHLQAGKSKTEILSMFQISFPALRLWLVRFIEDGIDGLKEGKRSGRKRKLSSHFDELFQQEVEKLQEDREGGRVTARDIQVMLKEKFSVDYALPSVYHVLERCNFSWISARSKHPKSDPAIQEDFKKKIPGKGRKNSS